MSEASKRKLEKLFKEVVTPALVKEYGYSPMQVIRIDKVVINMGRQSDKKKINESAEQMTQIAGQKAVITYARKSEAGFKIREGWPIGCRVTLRGHRMYAFLEKLIYLVLPRVRDFMGLKTRSFDGRGNYSFGLAEQIIFPEIDYEAVSEIAGMDITVTTTAKTDKEALSLLKLFGFPFRIDTQKGK
jgi:large subunit ribosomal protein L5